MSSNATIVVLANLVGITQPRDKETLTGAGWAKYDYDGGSIYKNRIAWTSKDGKDEVTTFASINCFGKRYQWIAENIKKGSPIVVCGSLLLKQGKDGKTYPEIQVHNIDLAPRAKAADGTGAEDAAPPEAPAAAKKYVPKAEPAAPKAVAAPQKEEDPDGLPF